MHVGIIFHRLTAQPKDDKYANYAFSSTLSKYVFLYYYNDTQYRDLQVQVRPKNSLFVCSILMNMDGSDML